MHHSSNAISDLSGQPAAPTDKRCVPPVGTLPDTMHTLIPPEGGEQWVNWDGKGWRMLALRDEYAPQSEKISTSPEWAYANGYRYKFAWDSLSASVIA